MEHWDTTRYKKERRRFIQQRIQLSPLMTQFTLIFAASWGAAWLCSWFLLRFFAAHHSWANSLPARYAIAFLFAYGCFFLAVRVWIDFIKYPPSPQPSSLSDWPNALQYSGDAEGCLFAIAILLAGFLISGLFLWTGGAPMLLEAAFEAAFAGVVVSRPLLGQLMLGDWKGRLLKNTWKRALVGLLALVALAAWLQLQAPEARTFAQAVHSLLEHERKNQNP